MEKGLILGVCGKARAGKDTVGKMLAEELFDISGRKFTLMAYATELKNKCQRLFDLSYEQLWGDQKEVEDHRYPKGQGGFWTAREILQFYGTDCMRAIDNDVWVKALFKIIKEKKFTDIIITDVRFPNEINPIKNDTGYIVNVESSRECIDNVHGKTHASETSLNNCSDVDFSIINDGSFDELRDSVKNVVEFIKVNEKIKLKTGGKNNG